MRYDKNRARWQAGDPHTYAERMCYVNSFRVVNILVDCNGGISSELGGSEGNEATSTIGCCI